MKKVLLTAVVATACIALSCSSQKKNAGSSAGTQWIDKSFADADKQYHYMKDHLPAGVSPRSLNEDGTLKTCTSENWVSGFYAGTLAYLYDATKDTAILGEAERRAMLLQKEQYNTNTHDLGFMMNCSFGNLYRITKKAEYKTILINSAKSLATRFNPKVGCIRSWGKSSDTAQFRVIIDNMMNLELLMWASKETGDQSLRTIAITHANTTMKNHFRGNYSSYHVVTYNPQTGTVISKKTAQGAADESAWARGQSWGLYGYTMMYRETKDKNYLEEAQHIASFILNNPHLPADKIPYWDYDAPGIPNTFRDASAAAVMAAALLELAGYSSKELADKYVQTARSILQTLASPAYTAAYGTNAGFLLMHSVAHLPAKTEVDKPLPYADYYFIEALERLKALR